MLEVKNKMKNTHITIVMENGKEVELTLSFGLLYQMRERDKDTYERYNGIVMNGAKEMLDYVDGLHAAYVCGCIEKGTEPEMNRNEFMDNLPYEMTEVVEVYSELFSPGKKLRLEDHLKKKQES